MQAKGTPQVGNIERIPAVFSVPLMPNLITFYKAGGRSGEELVGGLERTLGLVRKRLGDGGTMGDA
jgi:hypothetical protein